MQKLPMEKKIERKIVYVVWCNEMVKYESNSIPEIYQHNFRMFNGKNKGNPYWKLNVQINFGKSPWSPKSSINLNEMCFVLYLVSALGLSLIASA